MSPSTLDHTRQTYPPTTNASEVRCRLRDKVHGEAQPKYPTVIGVESEPAILKVDPTVVRRMPWRWSSRRRLAVHEAEARRVRTVGARRHLRTPVASGTCRLGASNGRHANPRADRLAHRRGAALGAVSVRFDGWDWTR